MKNKLLFLTLLLILSLAARSQNYFSETKDIMKITSLIRTLKPEEKDHISVKDHQVEVQSPLLDFLKSIAGGVIAPDVTDPDTTTSSAVTTTVIPNPKPGAIPADQPAGTTTKRVTRKAKAASAQAVTADKNFQLLKNDNEVLDELKYLAFLAFDERADDYTGLMGVFPQHFDHLAQILTLLQQQFAKTGTTAPTGQLQSSPFSGFSFSETAIIQGITDWAIKQAKEELMDVYLNRWYEKLKANGVIGPLIPQSLKVYDAFRQDGVLDLAKYGDKWKAAFQEDLRNIPVVFQDETYVGTVMDSLHVPAGKLRDELLPVISGGDELIYNLYLKKNLINQLSTMAGRYLLENNGNVPVFKRCVMMADLLTTICGGVDDQNKYVLVSPEEIKKMSVESWKTLFKLIVLRKNTVIEKVFDAGTPALLVKFLLQANSGLPGQLSTYIQETVTIINTYQNIMSNLPPSREISFDDTRKMFDLVAQFLGNSSKFFGLSGNAEVKECLKIFNTDVKPFLTYLSEIGEGISTQKYGKVLDGSVSVIRLVDSLANPQKPLSMQTIADLQLYGSFMLNILTAKNSAEVEAAIEEVIPKGQYKLKRQKTFSISLSVYPGAFGGRESISKYQTDNSGNIDYSLPKISSYSTSLSLYMPIGIDFNFGRQTHSSTADDRKYVTHSIFLQMFDLGAVFNYRLTGKSDTTEKTDPIITFKQLLSPGINYMYHFVNSPLVIGAGVNYTPELREISQKGNTYKANAFRFGIFAAVDVTAIILHVSRATPKEHKKNAE